MFSIKKESDISRLIGDPTFNALIAVNSDEEFSHLPANIKNHHSQYYEFPWSEEPTGVRLFDTNQGISGARNTYGTWAIVSKLYTVEDKPYRVSAADVDPAGCWDTDVDHVIGDFATLQQAIDAVMDFLQKEKLGPVSANEHGVDSNKPKRNTGGSSDFVF